MGSSHPLLQTLTKCSKTGDLFICTYQGDFPAPVLPQVLPMDLVSNPWERQSNEEDWKWGTTTYLNYIVTVVRTFLFEGNCAKVWYDFCLQHLPKQVLQKLLVFHRGKCEALKISIWLSRLHGPIKGKISIFPLWSEGTSIQFEVYQSSPLEIQTRIWIETLNNKFLHYKIER